MKKGLFSFISHSFLTAAVLVATLAMPGAAVRTYAAFDCLTITSSATAEQRQYCQNQINELEKEIAALNDQLATQKKKTGTLQGDINALTTQIAAKKKQITQKSLKLSQLTESIGEKEKAIKTLSSKIENERESLAQLLRKTNEMDQRTLTSFLFSSKSLSDFYSDVSRYDKLKSEVKASVDNIKGIKTVTEQKKADLEKQHDQTIDEKASLETVKKTIEQDQKTQKELLSISKNKEVAYEKLKNEVEARKNEIKARLFTLAGGSSAIRFDVALAYAEEAKGKTGIDPAFLLAILTQESALGKNVGQCFLTDTQTGAGVGANTGKAFTNVMKPTRDVQPFMDITDKLGYNWRETRVSCPIAGVAGWGGAMGPAQFIASTWKIFETRLKSALGHQPNPWAAEDAFMASSMYLTDLGAVGTSTAAQLRAACKYYGSGGSTCSYGRSVQTLKASIQADIDYLKQTGVSRR